jgi:hypothetical protein
MRDGKGFLLVYNITSRPTFDEVALLYDKILRTKDSEKVPMSVATHTSTHAWRARMQGPTYDYTMCMQLSWGSSPRFTGCER